MKEIFIELGIVGRTLEQLGFTSTLAEAGESLILFVIALLAIGTTGRLVIIPLVERVLDSQDLDKHAKTPLLFITKFLILFVAIAVAFGFAGFGNFLISFAGIAAAGALAVGLALQNVISNFVAGVFIYTDKPFRIGDWIEWENGTYAGTVEEISLRVTHVRTFDNELLTVPNSMLTEGVIKNPVDGDKLRLKFVFGIGYEDDIQEATEIILEEAEAHPDILDEPAPSVRLTELNDSDVGLQSRIWIADPSRGDFVRMRGEFITNVKKRFDEQGINIPYPIRTLDGGLALGDSQNTLTSPE